MVDKHGALVRKRTEFHEKMANWPMADSVPFSTKLICRFDDRRAKPFFGTRPIFRLFLFYQFACGPARMRGRFDWAQVYGSG
jgi:hypothetical protein